MNNAIRLSILGVSRLATVRRALIAEWIISLCVALNFGMTTYADEPALAKPFSPAALPSSLDRFNPIYFYQSQVAEIVPPSFRPIDLEELDERLKGMASTTLSPVEAPQFIRGVYLARLENNHLVSHRSYWDISYRGQTPARLKLGALGLALRSSTGAAADEANGQIVSDFEGDTSVVVDGDSRVVFGWTAGGKSIDRGTVFDLKIPASIQTRLLIEVPRGMQVQAIDGVGRALPSPPPEAGPSGPLPPPETETSWYSIDAGGLTRVRLRLDSTMQGDQESILSVRQASIQYDLQPQSIRFTVRTMVDAAPGKSLPMITVKNGSVASVRIGGSIVPWTEVTTSEGSGIRIDVTRMDPGSGSGTMNITIEGEAAWNSGGGSQSLPWPQWKNCRPILVATEMQSQIRLDASLNVLRMQLPPSWRFAPTATAEDGSRLFRCVGSLASEGPAVMVVSGEQQSSAESVLQLSATNTRFQAQLDASIDMSDTGPQPVHLRMDRGWTANFVMLPASGRVIDLSSDLTKQGNISIWPTLDELVNGRLQVRMNGSMPIRSVAGKIEFPATAFVTIRNCRNRGVATVTPPVGFSWSGEVALRTARITANDLSPIQKEMIGEVGPDSLLIDLNEGRIASLVSRRPDIAFDTKGQLSLKFEGNRLHETYLVACDSVSTDIHTIVVDLGAASGRPPMQWSALHVDGSSRRLLSSTLLSASNAMSADGNATVGSEQIADSSPSLGNDSTTDARTQSPNEIWRLELGDASEREVMLVGRREYDFEKSKELPLPKIPDASNQTAQIVVMPSLSATQLGISVLKVPRLSTQGTRISRYGAIPAECEPFPGCTVLRYDATEQASITISPSRKAKEIPIVWRESVRIEASNRGGDTVTAAYDIDRGAELVVNHDVNLRLVSVTDLWGAPVEHKAEPTRLLIAPSPSATRVIVNWTRAVFSASITRGWLPPRMKVDAIVLRRDWRLIPAPDTLIPSALLFGESQDLSAVALLNGNRKDAANNRIQEAASVNHDVDSAISVELNGGRVWIVDSGLGYTVASMLGLCMFAVGWWIASRSPLIAALFWVTSVVPPVFLFVTTILWYSSVCVPLAAGGLVAMTLTPHVRRWGDAVRSSISAIPIPTSAATSGQNTASEERHHGSSRGSGFSWTGRHSSLVLFASFHALVFEANMSVAQAPPATPVTNQSVINSLPFVLVPADADGNIAGSKVYLTQSFYAELFRDRLPVVVPVRTKAASYRLRLEGTADLNTTAELEARYQIEDTEQRTEMRLPFAASQIRTAQWLTTSDSRPLRWSADGDSAIRLTLPAASSASLIVRVTCAVNSPSRISRTVRFPIPPIASSTLVVDAGFAVHHLELTELMGEQEVQPELGRLTASLGAVSEVDLTISLREAARVVASIAQRRYWVHAGYDRTNIECEVDIADATIRKGGEVSLVILDGQLPLVMTDDWAIVTNESVSPIRRQLTLRSQRDNPGPIRFLWELDSLIASTAPAEDSDWIVIPEVLSAGAAATPPAVIALDAAQGLRLNTAALGAGGVGSKLAVNKPTSAEAIDAFISSWKGFRGTAGEVMTSDSPLTRFVIATPPSRPWQTSEVQHLHVRPGELQLSYNSIITPGDRLVGPLRVVLPLGCELRLLTVNDVAVETVPLRVGKRSEVCLPEPIGTDVIRVHAELYMRVSQADEFSPPRISVEPIPFVTGSYTLSRDQSLLVKEVTDGGLIEAVTPAMRTDEQLAGGWVPCWTWRLDEVQPLVASDSTNKPQLPGSFRVEQRDITIESQQRTSLVWAQTRWSVETLLRLRGVSNSMGVASREPIDFVNVELPTIWCDNLTVEPAEAWSRQPSIDPTKQIVRIRPEQVPGVDGFVTISLRGQRSIDSDMRLEVPSVRVLGNGKRDVYMTVPKRIEGRPLEWEAIATRGVQLPNELLHNPFPADEGLEDVNQEASTANHRTGDPDSETKLRDEIVFRSTGGNASVWLAPSRLEAASARITMADFQLFPASDQETMVICRWDLNPGQAEQITVDLPKIATPVEVWIDDEVAAWESSDSKINIRLALSRLAQSVVLVCRFKASAIGTEGGMPKVRNIPVDQTWVTHFEPDDGGTVAPASNNLRDGWQRSTVEDRLLGLVESIRTVTESSLSRATDRSQDEVVQWITSWDQRFRRLVDDADPARKIELESKPSEEAATTKIVDVNAIWNEQERKWRQYLSRIIGEVVLGESKRPRAFVPPNHWRTASVAKHTGEATSMPVIRIVTGTKTLAVAIQAMLMLTIAAGLTLLLWRARTVITPLACHPASWLFATGLVSLAIAPIPVAVAICCVALTSPLLTSPKIFRLRHQK